MVDWKSATEMARDLYVAKYLCLLFLGAIVVDFAHSLRFDYNMIRDRKKSGRVRWPQFCYLFSKLAYFPYWTLTFMTGDPSWKIDCRKSMFFSELFMGIVTCMCSALLAFRTLCVWEERCGRPFKVTLLLLWLGLLASWIIGSFDVTGKWIEGIGQPWVHNKGACWFDPIPFRYAYKFVATVLFDGLVLGLTLAGVLRSHGRSRIGTILMEQGIIYFVVTLVFNVILIVFAWADMNAVMSVIMSVPTQTVSVMAATRLYVQLFQQTTGANRSKQTNFSSSLPSTTTSSRKQTSSFFGFSRGAKESSRMDTSDFAGDSMFESKTILPGEGEQIGCKKATVVVLCDGDVEKQDGGVTVCMQQKASLQRPKETQATQTRGASVLIEETHSTASEPLPPHLKGSHFLSRQQLRDLGEESADSGALLEYPRLSSLPKRPSTDGSKVNAAT